MTPEEKMRNLMGLAMRAGMLISGEEMTIKAIQHKEARLVLVATDASNNTREKMKNKCQFYSIPFTSDFTAEEISQAIGKSRSICAFTDKGFADSYQRLKGTSQMR